ncbi:MAG TPA: hypothetical protein VNR87_07085 [Flavisolibacter sp.]|nr:hypothetical protein [Flavisolibacter sp.]
MKRQVSSIVFPALVAFTLASCEKEASVSNDKGNGAINFQLMAKNTSSPVSKLAIDPSVARENGAAIEWKEGTANAIMIKFEAERSGSEVEFRSSVQRTINLFDPAASLGNISLPVGTYDEVEFKAKLSPSAGQPALELKGEFNNGASVIKITFRADEEMEIKGEKKNVNITDSIVHRAVTQLNLALAGRGISAPMLASAVTTTGQIIISQSLNKDLYRIILKNLRELHEEEDFH